MEGFLIILAIALVVGSLLGWITLIMLVRQRDELNDLKREVRELLKREVSPAPEVKPAQSESIPETKITESPVTEVSEEEITGTVFESPDKEEPEFTTNTPDAADETTGQQGWSTPSHYATPEPNPFFESLKENWMTWLGGLSTALAGIFLARYSIEQGLIGPTARIVLGILMGIGLHVGAEYLRRRTQESNQIFAMLAGSGSVTLFAVLLAALHYYEMFSPGLVFAVLGVVALVTMWLALLHGPALAAMGMLGAYTLPIFVSTGQGNHLIALIYALVISASLLLLMRYVYRYWLYIGVVLGAMFWWTASYAGQDMALWRCLYLTVFSYLLLAVSSGDWLLIEQLRKSEYTPAYQSVFRPFKEEGALLLPALVIQIITFGISLLTLDKEIPSLSAWLPFVLLMLWHTRQNSLHVILGWLLFISQFTSLLVQFVEPSATNALTIGIADETLHKALITYLLLTSLVYIMFAVEASKNSLNPHWLASLGVFVPLLLFVTGYLLTDFAADWQWVLLSLLLGVSCIVVNDRLDQKQYFAWHLWLLIGANFAIAVAFSILLTDATLTLALASQLIVVALLIKRYDIPMLVWLLRVISVLIIIRLSLNPWLLDYSTETHWSLWSYGGSTVCAFIAAALIRNTYPKISRWCEALGLHLLALTLWVETRYYLYGGEIFKSEFTFVEATLDLMIFGLLGLSYRYRATLSEHLSWFYRGYSTFLLALASLYYLIILFTTLGSDSWVYDSIGSKPILNIMLLSYGLPALLCLAFSRMYEGVVSKWALRISAVTAFLFVNFEIRHLWQGRLKLSSSSSDAELYTYSTVWLVLAVITMILSSLKQNHTAYKGGMLLLLMTVLKVFLIDLSELDGVYRILAFMALGLSLLGIAYLHRKLGVPKDQSQS